MGIDGHAISVHPSQFLYFLEPISPRASSRCRTRQHLAAAAGASQVVIGTDFGFRIARTTPVDTVLQTPGLTAAEQRGTLGENAARLLRL